MEHNAPRTAFIGAETDLAPSVGERRSHEGAAEGRRSFAALVWVALGMATIIAVVGSLDIAGYDRYALPKELALCLLAWPLAIVSCFYLKHLRWSIIDVLALAFAAATLASLWNATNIWYGYRSLSQTLAACVLFLVLSQMQRQRRWLLTLVAGAGVLAAALMLSEAHAWLPAMSMPGRGPAGTGGNRNFVAHLLVLTWPALVWVLLQQRRAALKMAWLFGGAVVVAMVLVSRSRGAWLAFLACSLAMVLALSLSKLKRQLCSWAAALPLAATALGAAIALLPTTASLNVDAKALSHTYARLLEHESGTGRGRLIQYRNTLNMCLSSSSWFLGVGAGNWSLHYVRFASAEDPNLHADPFQPVNRLPNTDWLAVWAERGLLGLIVLVLMFAATLRSAAISVGAKTTDAIGLGVVMIGSTVALAVSGSFDALMLRAEPLAVAAVAFSAMERDRVRTLIVSRNFRLIVLGTSCLLGTASVGLIIPMLRSRAMLAGDAAAQSRAVELSPGDYITRGKLALHLAAEGKCDEARKHSEVLVRQFPLSVVPPMVRDFCSVRAEPRSGREFETHPKDSHRWPP